MVEFFRFVDTWSLKPKAVGATMSTSFVDCRTPEEPALELFKRPLVARVTSGTCIALNPSLCRNLQTKLSL